MSLFQPDFYAFQKINEYVQNNHPNAALFLVIVFGTFLVIIVGALLWAFFGTTITDHEYHPRGMKKLITEAEKKSRMVIHFSH